jgi:hypothetical protein
MFVTVTLTSATPATGPFNIYQNTDSYTVAIATNVSKPAMFGGYTVVANDLATILKIESVGTCNNSIFLDISGIPSPTPTQTPTVTPTPTTTTTPTVTPTNTQTPTNTSTPTVTPTNTQTPTVTNTPTNTSTPTVTPTNTQTPTVTNTPTNTTTPTVTPTNTPSPTSVDNVNKLQAENSDFIYTEGNDQIITEQ